MAQEGYELDPKIPMTYEITTRDGSLNKDSKMVNMMVEPVEGGGKAAVKRPGTRLIRQLTAGKAQGMFTVNNVVYAIQNDTIVSTVTGLGTVIPAVTTPGQIYNTLSDVPFGLTLLKSQTGLWTYNGVTVTKVVDVNYPALTVYGISYLDGTYYVMDGTGTIFGSALQDATTWPVLNFIKADSTLGLGAAIGRHLNYVTALYEHGTQLFYDAGNPTGSPLSPAGNASWTTGTPVGASLVETSDNTIFMSQTKTRGRSVSMISGLSLQEISTPFISKILNISQLTDAGGQVYSFAIKTAGHSFYVLTLTDIGVTMVYDLVMQEWGLWSSSAGGVETHFKGVIYQYSHAVDFLMEENSGAIVAMDPLVYVDIAQQINCFIRTKQHDWGTLRTKRFPSQSLIADTVASTVNVRYSDDDYTTFSAYRALDMSTVRKMLLRNGRSRRRSWDFLHVAATPFKVYEMEFNDLSVSAT